MSDRPFNTEEPSHILSRGHVMGLGFLEMNVVGINGEKGERGLLANHCKSLPSLR